MTLRCFLFFSCFLCIPLPWFSTNFNKLFFFYVFFGLWAERAERLGHERWTSLNIYFEGWCLHESETATNVYKRLLLHASTCIIGIIALGASLLANIWKAFAVLQLQNLWRCGLTLSNELHKPCTVHKITNPSCPSFNKSQNNEPWKNDQDVAWMAMWMQHIETYHKIHKHTQWL
jgi:hypothetical protein